MPLRPRHGYAADLHRGLPTDNPSRPGSSPHSVVVQPNPGTHRAPARIRQIGAGFYVEGLYGTGSSRAPSCLAHRTRPVWQYQTVPTLSGLLPPSQSSPRSVG